MVSVTARPLFDSGERTPGTHWIRARAGLDTGARRKVSSGIATAEASASWWKELKRNERDNEGHHQQFIFQEHMKACSVAWIQEEGEKKGKFSIILVFICTNTITMQINEHHYSQV